jgi:hypothetical protein
MARPLWDGRVAAPGTWRTRWILPDTDSEAGNLAGDPDACHDRWPALTAASCFRVGPVRRSSAGGPVR